MDITADIQDAIAKQLPAQVGEVLRVRLEQAEKDAKERSILESRNAEQRREIQQLEARVTNRDIELKKAGDLNARAADLDKRERDLRITLLEAQLAASNTNATFAKEVALGLVRNVEYRHSVFETNSKQVPTAPGSYTMSQTDTSNKSDTSTAA